MCARAARVSSGRAVWTQGGHRRASEGMGGGWLARVAAASGRAARRTHSMMWMLKNSSLNVPRIESHRAGSQAQVMLCPSPRVLPLSVGALQSQPRDLSAGAWLSKLVALTASSREAPNRACAVVTHAAEGLPTMTRNVEMNDEVRIVARGCRRCGSWPRRAQPADSHVPGKRPAALWTQARTRTRHGSGCA